MNVRYKVADVETAGFAGPNESGSGVAEIGWVEIDENTNIIDQRQSLINPGRPIEVGAQEVHGISDMDVAYSPTLETYYRNSWTGGPTTVICHNRNFDIKFLAHCYDHLSGSLCTLELARQYIPEAPNHKLITLAQYFGFDAGESHRALDDCHTTLLLLRKIMEITGRSLPDLIKLAEKPKVLPVMPFGKHKGKKFGDLPTDYLDWLLSANDMPKDVLISAEMARKLK